MQLKAIGNFRIFCPVVQLIIFNLAFQIKCGVSVELKSSTEFTPQNEGSNNLTSNLGSDPDPEDMALLQSNDPRNVAFYLYPNNEDVLDHDEILLGNKNSLQNSRYNASNPPIFLIHGFLNNYTTKFSQSVKNAYLEHGYNFQHNILVVDWGKLSSPANYSAWSISHINDWNRDLFYKAAVSNVPKVGNRVTEFVTFLMDENYLDTPANVHIIGFSLGAQISGFAGLYTKQNGTTPIGRITGLDPAGPLYQQAVGIDKKLDSTDADFVDVCHSNQGQDGYYGNIGTVDFYPNGGGPTQPDCYDSIDAGVVGSSISGSCAHNRAWKYYIKSLSENITACRCLSQADWLCKAFCATKASFGHYCPLTAKGSFYFDISVKDT